MVIASSARPLPWARPGDQKALMDPIGLANRLVVAPTGPQQFLHIHQHLDVFVNGNPVVVPANIGINFDPFFISYVHTHHTDGVIHVEAYVGETFYLGQFFREWDVRLTPTCLGAYCDASGVLLFVNGKLQQGDPAAWMLADHQELAVVFGTPPPIVPSSYDFSQVLG
jgi:hypothetical protein